MLVLLAFKAASAAECPTTIDGLPDAPWLDRTDPRLRGASLVVVLKEERRVGVYKGGALEACWPAALASGYVPGPKQAQGNRRTPEGWYRTSDRPESAFYHALDLHYPSASDADLAFREGRIGARDHAALLAAAKADRMPPDGTPLGGLVLMHGGGSSADWTLGCVALENADMDALRALLPRNLHTDVALFP